MTRREVILAVLEVFDVDPEQRVACAWTTGNRTAFEVLESHIMAAMDEIEDRGEEPPIVPEEPSRCEA